MINHSEPMRLLVIINPNASTVANLTPETLADQVHASMASIEDAPEYQILIPESPAHMRQVMTQKLASGEINRIAVAGGDGTVQETLPVMDQFPHVPVGLIPLGTGNLLALNIGIPSNLDDALRIVIHGEVRTVDLGKINGKTFILNASIGIDAEIMKKTDRKIKKKLGRWAYWVTGFSLLPNVRNARLRIETEKQVIWTRAIGVNISNTCMRVPGGIVLSPEAELDDGYMHATIFKMRRLWDWIEAVIYLIFNFGRENSHMIESLDARRIRIEAWPPLVTQADGNVIGKTPALIEVLPYKLKLCMPPGKEAQNCISPTDDALVADPVRKNPEPAPPTISVSGGK